MRVQQYCCFLEKINVAWLSDFFILFRKNKIFQPMASTFHMHVTYCTIVQLSAILHVQYCESLLVVDHSSVSLLVVDNSSKSLLVVDNTSKSLLL